MHSHRIFTFWGLSIAATAQIVPSTADRSSAALPNEGGILFGGHYSTTMVDQSPPYTIYECEFEAEAHYGGFSQEETCNAISTITKLPLDISTVKPNQTVVSTAAAGKRHIVDPASVLEARMERKFGVKPRSIPAIFRNDYSPVFPSVVTVTSTTTLFRIPESCIPSPSPIPFPIFHDIPETAPLPAAEITAMSIVASMLTKDIATLSPTGTSTQLPSNIISIMVSVLTANVSAMTTSMSAPNSNMSITSASLTSVTTAPPFTATSDGASAKVGVSAAIVAAIGVACLLA